MASIDEALDKLRQNARPDPNQAAIHAAKKIQRLDSKAARSAMSPSPRGPNRGPFA